MTSNRKMEVLLISPEFFSAIGMMARNIAEASKDINFYFFSSADIKKHKGEFLKMTDSVDIIHWLANLSWVKLPPGINPNEFPVPTIATVYHVDGSLRGQGEKEESSKILFASQCDAIQVISSEWKDYVQSRTDTPVFLARPAINPNVFKATRNLKRPGSPFRIGTFGFSREIKNRK